MRAKILRRERYSTGANLNLLIQDEPEVLEGLMKLPDEVDLLIKKLFNKRSKNANDYAWEIMGQMASKLCITKEEVYLEMLKKYGQSVIVTVREGIDPGRLFKYYEFFNDGLHNGKKFVAYKVFIGTSQYSTEEMSIFIDGIVKEAKELGIQTELFMGEMK